MFSIEPIIKPSLRTAVLITAAIIALISFSIISLEAVPHIPIFISILLLLLFGLIKKLPYSLLEKGMLDGAKSGMGAVYIFLLIGLLIGSWIIAGTIPTMIDAAFLLVTPNFFYSVVFVVTGIVGLGIGSSLTTVATLGVAFLGVSQVMDASAAITAGAVVSGAFFGDKMSPISDTTNLAASVVGVDLFTHIRNMGWTTIPAFFLSLVAFSLLSPEFGQTEFPKINEIREVLANAEMVHWYAWLPLILLFILSIKKVPALISLTISTVSGVAISFLHSGLKLSEVFTILFSGYVSKTGNADVDALLTRGGMESMMFTVSLVLLSLSLGSLLFLLGIVPQLFASIEHKMKTTGNSITAAAASAIGLNIVIGEQYLSILLTGKAFKDQFERVGLAPKNLSRTLEDAGTVINPLVPWSVCGIFITKILGVSTISYLPFAFFCLLSPLLTILFGLSGITITRKDK